MKIRVGSKVQLQGIPSYLKGVENGDEGVVQIISDDVLQPYHVRFEDGQVRTFARKELKIIKE